MGGRLLVSAACLSWWLLLCGAQVQFVKWRPMDVVARLIVAKIDPVEAYHALEAVRNRPIEGALRAVLDLHLDIDHLYNVLRDMRIDPLDAFLALQLWVKDRSSESVDDTDETKSDSSIIALAEEIQSLLNKIVKAFKENALQDLAEEAKELASKVNDPKKLFQDFFGYNELFQSFKRLHPAAFEAVKNILFGRSFPQASGAAAIGQQQQQQQALPQQQAQPQSQPQLQNTPPPPPQPQPQSQPQQQQQQQQQEPQRVPQTIQQIHSQLHANDADLQDPQFADATRFNLIHDESHVYNKGPQDPAGVPRRTLHNIRRYYDKVNQIVLESLKTIEYHDSGLKTVRKTVRTIDNSGKAKKK